MTVGVLFTFKFPFSLAPKGPKQKWPLIHQPWFHGPMERTEASALLEKDGDFFVRESTTKKGQFVLTAMANKQAQNLLLIDSTGKASHIVVLVFSYSMVTVALGPTYVQYVNVRISTTKVL